ncbi:MAG: hypothetical protein AB1778_00275 [Candidatus Bipolaricaulota bacterium]
MITADARIWTTNARATLRTPLAWHAPLRSLKHLLAIGRCVGAEEAEGDEMQRLIASLREQQAEAKKLDEAIAKNMKELGHGE